MDKQALLEKARAAREVARTLRSRDPADQRIHLVLKSGQHIDPDRNGRRESKKDRLRRRRALKASPVTPVSFPFVRPAQ